MKSKAALQVLANSGVLGGNCAPPDLQRQLFHQIIPAYILDTNFQYLDWNPAFDEILARPLGLRRGMHGTLLLSRLANCDEVMERSLKVFSLGNHPLVDAEPILLKSERYGLIRFHKMASQILDERGQKRAWALTLNISTADNLDLLWSDILRRVEQENAYHQYVSSRDLLLSSHEEAIRLLSRLTGIASSSSKCLELGSGAGELTRRLAEVGGNVWSQEDNFSLLEILSKRLAQGVGKISLVRESIDHLEEYPSDFFDSVVSWDGLWRRAGAGAIFSSLARTLKPGGILSLVLRIGNDGAVGNTASTTSEVAKINLERSVKILDAHSPRPSAEELGRSIDAAGFEIQELETGLCGGSMAFVLARKA